MSNKILKDFKKFSKSFTNQRIRQKIEDVCKEVDLNYAADELLLLSEEILNQVSAFGVCLYLQRGGVKQKEWNNDYILQDLFLNQGHQNAGPIFYKVRDIVNEIKTQISENEFKLFDSESNINIELQELAAFRNALMHGFFKLPAERNSEFIKKIQVILEKLLNDYEIFKHKGDFHFWKNEGFSGHWNIQDDVDWNNLAGDDTSFEKLARCANDELHSVDFVNSVSFRSANELEHKGKVEDFIAKKNSSNFKESLYVQFHPLDKKQQDEFYKSAYVLLSQKKDVELFSITIEENGIGYTSYLLFARLVSFLTLIKTKLIHDLNDEKKIKGLKLSDEKSKNKLKDKVEYLINDIGKLDKEKKIVILINNISLVSFASNHITSLMKFYKDFGIYFIGIGWEYEHLNSIFSQKINLRKEKNIIPDATEIELLLKNHTRHRGPYENEKDYTDLKSLIHLISNRLKKKKSVIVRRLADEESLDIELINEALYILYPYFKYNQSGDDTKYFKDDLDELYGFPKTQTETSSIFLTLGRRDIELEYKHKILKP